MPLTCQQPANRIQTRLVQFPLFTLQSQILAQTTNRIVYFGTVEQLTNVGSLKGVIKYLQQHYRVHLQVLGETCSSFLSQRVAFIAPGRRREQSTGNGRSKQSKVHLPWIALYMCMQLNNAPVHPDKPINQTRILCIRTIKPLKNDIYSII